MASRKWLPASWFGDKDDESPFGSLRKQIDGLFEDFDKGILSKMESFSIRSNVSETDKEVCITAELPGIELDDIDVSVSGNRIMIKGEKKSEEEERKDDEGREFHRIERRSGSFQRMLTLPFDIDPETVKAETRDGVLTVIISKPPEAVQEKRTIEVKKSA